jgi:hypothetical protein
MVAEIEKRISRLPNEPGQCLHIAHQVCNVLHKFDQYAVIQAGSLQWPRLRREDDDGVVDTHFSYMWSPLTPQSVVSMAAGNLPEMHVWVGMPDEQILIDFTTKFLTLAAAKLGMAWTAPEPPKYLWTSARALPDRVVYTPNAEATLLACRILRKLYKPVWLA